MIDTSFWKNKRVFVTGHTGFKGSWLSLWLHAMGARVTGYSLAPATDPNLFETAGVSSLVDSIIADIRDYERLHRVVADAKPEIVFHLAAQPLVRASYANPVETYATNVMGTVNLLEAVRHCGGVQAVVNVTTDKVYENHERLQGYREGEPLGGFDPYSNSKACSELVTAAYRSSFFTKKVNSEQLTVNRKTEEEARGQRPEAREEKAGESGDQLATGNWQLATEVPTTDHQPLTTAVASARAGNVIGGGDWSADRLLPDCIRSLSRSEKIVIRNPGSVRPWQFVLEPLSGYLLLAENLCRNGGEFASAWNFGPSEHDQKPVSYIADLVCRIWGNGAARVIDGDDNGPHEAGLLTLNSSKARSLLKWEPRLGLDRAIELTVDWYKRFFNGDPMDAVCREQIEAYATRPATRS